MSVITRLLTPASGYPGKPGTYKNLLAFEKKGLLSFVLATWYE